MKRALLAVLFCAGCYAAAQSPTPLPQWKPIQKVDACPRVGVYSQPCYFANPVMSGDLIVVAGVGGGEGSVFDNLGNRLILALAIQQYNGISLWYETAPMGFTNVTFAPGTNWWDSMLEYPPSTGLDDAAYANYVDAGVNAKGQEIQDNSGWAGVHRKPGDYTLSPVETHESCELLISWALIGQGTPVAGQNFTIRTYNPFGAAVNGQGLVVEDSTTTIPDYQQASVRWRYANSWDMGLAAFKMKGCHQ